MKEKSPNELIVIEKKVVPANYDIITIIKHLQGMEKVREVNLPMLIFYI